MRRNMGDSREHLLRELEHGPKMRCRLPHLAELTPVEMRLLKTRSTTLNGEATKPQKTPREKKWKETLAVRGQKSASAANDVPGIRNGGGKARLRSQETGKTRYRHLPSEGVEGVENISPKDYTKIPQSCAIVMYVAILPRPPPAPSRGDGWTERKETKTLCHA